MLIILALVFLFADVVLGGFDIIPDCVGFLLLFAFLAQAALRRELSRFWAALGLLGFVISVLVLIPALSAYLLLPGWLLSVILPFFLVRRAFSLCLDRAMVRPVAPDSAEREASLTLVTAALALILICELAAPLLSLFWNFSRYLILGIKSLAGLFVLLCFIRIIYKKQY